MDARVRVHERHVGGDGSTLMVSAFVFLSAAALAFGVMAVVQVRFAVKRRAAGNLAPARQGADDDPRSLRYASKVAAQRLIDYTAKHYSAENKRRDQGAAAPADPGRLPRYARAASLLPRPRRRGGRARARGVSAGADAAAAPRARCSGPRCWIGGLAGYFAPNVYLSRRIAGRQVEHRAGFPDFMDLLVVCADAGLSMEAALDRVGRELAD